MEQVYNLILVGGTGTGKTHLATAIGIAAIHQGKRGRFYNAVDLIATSWKPATIPIDLNNGKRRWKTNNRTI